MTYGSDKRVAVEGRRRPGYQPGRWRLSLGKCAVGALALSRSPRNERSRVGQERGGLQAKVVDLHVTKGGRDRSRIRRGHRECHQKSYSKFPIFLLRLDLYPSYDRSPLPLAFVPKFARPPH